MLTNVTVDLSPHGEQDDFIKPADFSNGVPEQNNTFLVGTTSSQKEDNTANSTQHAAVALCVDQSAEAIIHVSDIC